jgi:hypothetical protein
MQEPGGERSGSGHEHFVGDAPGAGQKQAGTDARKDEEGVAVFIRGRGRLRGSWIYSQSVGDCSQDGLIRFGGDAAQT